MQRYEDKDDPHNGPEHHTGKECITTDCKEPAGTWWSPLWCQACNAARIKRIDGNLKDICRDYGIAV
ncbi:hypothetical protein DELTA_45 [Brevundimonas phage vB_BsubS-Delta]|nr:hypothetical protein DELTA_45 [Brevundimonas phage vB_BsubS-Delta]